jgi:diguanylate cyclase (GGDEF)-like protein
MDLISAKLAVIVPWTGCALFLKDHDSDDLHCRYVAGADMTHLLDSHLRSGEGLSGWAALHRRPLLNLQPRMEFEAAGRDIPATLSSAVVCPLELGERLIGVLALYHSDADRYTDDHMRLLVRVAEQAAAVLSNAIVFEQTQEESLTDPLTGLPNRRLLAARLTSELARAERMHGDLAVLVLDVDGFKLINDTHGHAVGDEVLRQIARTLGQALRPYDLCVRFAGDEFVVLLGDCPPDFVEEKRQELQRLIEEIGVKADGLVVPAGASAGAAVYPQDGRTYDALIATADRRMYSDKALRRRFAKSASPVAAREWERTAAMVRPPAAATRPN